MYKNYKKWIKSGIVGLLIVSFMMPSYASLSASDGSAFVTKSEFDSAISDFNARLTTFEAGINSKIDSQVTSYLDRNGIWNGTKQTVIMGPTNFDAPGTVSESTNHFHVALLDKTMVNEVSKSGFCYVNWTLRCPNPRTTYQSGIGYRFIRRNVDNSTFHNAQNFDLEYSQNGDVKTIQELAKCNAVWGNGGSSGGDANVKLFIFWYVPQNYYYGTSMFFVKKGQNLKVRLLMSYYFDFVTLVSSECSTCEYAVTDCVVY